MSMDDLTTVEDMRNALLPILVENAGFDGWGDTAFSSAARQLGLEPDIVSFAYEDGAISAIDHWFRTLDMMMVESLMQDEAFKEAGISMKIHRAVMVRFAHFAPHREALRRAQAVMAQPPYIARAAKLGWRTVDRIWRTVGDKSTDYNHYTKRTMLLGVYSSSLLIFLNDESENMEETSGFLHRRIGNVLQIEKAKAQWINRERPVFRLSSFLSKLRYPAR